MSAQLLARLRAAPAHLSPDSVAATSELLAAEEKRLALQLAAFDASGAVSSASAAVPGAASSAAQKHGSAAAAALGCSTAAASDLVQTHAGRREYVQWPRWQRARVNQRVILDAALKKALRLCYSAQNA